MDELQKQINKNIRHVFWFFFTLFAITGLYFTKFIFFDSKNIINSAYNPRISMLDNKIKRGSIVDYNGVMLTYSENNEGTYERIYPYHEMFAHIIGYVSVGKSGIEAKSNFELQNLKNELYQRFSQVVHDHELAANSLVLTLDYDIQKLAFEKLGNQKGAIIVMEPSTGKIIAQVSYPHFNPNTISETWNELRLDDSSPLLNRATQGLYAPGSVFKILTAAAIIENIENYQDITYECTGSHQFTNKIIHCHNSKAHGVVDIYGAMAYSCNTFFAYYGMELGYDMLIDTAEKAYYNQSLRYPLEYSQSIFNLNENSSENEFLETLIGQGRTLVSPLHTAMVVSAVANGGMMMTPYVIDHSIFYNNNTGNKTMPQKLDVIFSETQAEELTKMMVEAVNYGTGVNAKISQVTVAGKTGTAETESGKSHAWFAGFAPAQDPKAVVVVLLENAGEGSKAVPIARDLLQAVISKGY